MLRAVQRLVLQLAAHEHVRYLLSGVSIILQLDCEVFSKASTRNGRTAENKRCPKYGQMIRRRLSRDEGK